MLKQRLFDDGARSWYYFGRDPEKGDALIDTNEYLITHNGRGMLLDPGGLEIFPSVVTAISSVISIDDIDVIFSTHQDPDVISSLSLWNTLNDHVQVYAPWVWEGFIPHFGGGKNILPVPDEGMTLGIGGANDIDLVPCHYVHSSGHFTVYDPRAKILFSSDIGAALLPPDHQELFVSNFDQHIQYMEGFHRRWMPSNRAKNAWINRVRKLDINMMCPQHGAIFKGNDVQRFLDWFEELEVGTAVER